MKKIYPVLIILFFLVSCSTLPKNKNENIQNTGTNLKSDGDTVILEIGENRVFMSEFKEKIKELSANYKLKKNISEYYDNFVFYKILYYLARDMGIDKTETYKKNLKNLEEQVLLELFEKKIMEESDKVTDLEINEYYLKNIDSFTKPSKVALINILSDSLVVMQELKDKFSKGFKIQDIKNDTELNKKIIVSDLGYLERGLLEPELESVAFTLKEKQFTSVIQTKFGYHILFCYKISEPNVIQLDEELKNEIKSMLDEIAFKSKMNDKMESFKKNNKVNISYPSLDEIDFK